MLKSAIKKQRKIEKYVKVVIKCPECDYKTVIPTELKRHNFQMHNKVIPKGAQSLYQTNPSKSEEVKVNPVINLSPES